ncbi:MAG: DUF2911 domain-containing protein [Gemmatimonadota bacterium]
MTAGLRAAIVAAMMICALPVASPAQIRASELGSITQMIDGTKLTITYSRPRTRGRTKLFGTPAAHWGETWTPGANWATTLEVSKDVTIGGRPVPKGKYAVWMILKEQGDWTMVLDPDSHRFHMDPPDSAARQIRFPVTIDQAQFVDVLTWSIPELSVGGGTIAMQWGTTRATMKLVVQPSLKVELAESEARPYLGKFRYTEMEGRDSGKTKELILTHENGTLKAQFEPNDNWMGKFAMIRVAPEIFAPGLYDKSGEIYEVLRPDMLFTFKRVAGRPATFEVRYDDDTLAARGVRFPN